VDETKLKDCNCRRCGFMIKANIRTSENVYCKSCREDSKCLLCGQYKCLDRPICSKHGIINSLKRLGFDESKLGSIDFYQEYERIKNLMIEEYEVKEMTLTQIGVKYNINFQTLSYLFKNLGVKVRTLSESSHLYVKNTTNPNPMPMSKKYKYKSGWHESWMGTQHFYRSSYEQDYFIKLDTEKVVYETESLRIEYFDTTRNKKRIAIPDIFIPSENLIIEIKSTYTYDELNMNDRVKSFKSLGYKMNLILGRDKKKLLKNYEVIEY
jgi:hypothetical protein